MRTKTALVLGLLTMPVVAGPLDSAHVLFTHGVRAYDRQAFVDALKTLGDRQGPAAHILRGRCYWRLQLLAYVESDKKVLTSEGNAALQALNDALAQGADTVSVLTVRVRVHQLLASTGMVGGARYGPASASDLELLESRAPRAYGTRLAAAWGLMETPAFAGGNPRKALQVWFALRGEYPDSVDCAVGSARATARRGEHARAVEMLDSALAVSPNHRLARLFRDEAAQGKP